MAELSTRSGAGTQRLWGEFTRSRSRDLRNRLIERYVPLVRAIAARIAQRLPPHIETDDLQSAGVFGLVKSIESFDPERGVKFETYCRKRISGAILDELRRQDSIPREARERADHVCRTLALLRETLGREPTDHEVADAMHLSLRDVHAILLDAAFATQIPLEGHILDSTGGGSPLEPVDAFPEPPELVHQRELIGMVKSSLSNRERTIVQSYYHDDLTMKRIGSRLRLSESRVCQMHTSLLSRLKERLHEEISP